MAKRTNPNEMLDTVVLAESVTFRAKERSKEDPTKWVVKQSFTVECANVPDRLVNGDDLAGMKSYGIRAFLCDRSSDVRSHGVYEYLKSIQENYEKTLAVGVYRAQRESKARSAGLDPLLVQALVDLKGLTPETAIASLKALTPDQLTALKANPKIADAIKAARATAAEAEAVDLGDLL